MRQVKRFGLWVGLALLLVIAGYASPVAAQSPHCVETGACIGFPDADANSGRFINVTRGLSSLGDVGTDQKVFNVYLIIPGTEPDFELNIFDGDMGGKWDRFLGNRKDDIDWHLYADPNQIGDRSIEVWTHPAEGMEDNAWHSALIVNDSRAIDADGNYRYHLVADWTTFRFTDQQNNFKIAVEGTPYLPAGSTVGFEGFGPSLLDLRYPSNTYDGSFTFRFYVPSPTTFIDLYDGDMDRGDDTDDANSPNLPPNVTGTVTDPLTTWPPFQTSGGAGCVECTRNPAEGAYLGNPYDDYDLGHRVRISPSVIYHVTAPDKSWTVTNAEPSGDREWERFRIQQTGTTHVDGLPADVTAPSLPAGFYEWRWEGLDALNTVFVHLDYDLYPGLGALGNTVWHDLNKDGVFGTTVIAGGLDLNDDGVVDGLDDGTLVVEGVSYTVIDGSVDMNRNGSIDAGDDGVLLGINVIDGKLNMSGLGSISMFDFGRFLNEPGIQGVKVNLYLDVNGDGALDSGDTFVSSLVTDANGYYKFMELDRAKYLVEVDQSNFALGGVLAGKVQTPVSYPESAEDHHNRTTPWPVTLPTNLYYPKADFGYVAAPPAAIGNYVWIDENEDGYQDAGERGLPNVTVLLKDSQGNVLATTTTDAHGGYLFKNLVPGAYVVEVNAATLPAGLHQTTNPVLPGADFGNQSQPYVVTVGPGEENLTADFGYVWANPNGNTGPAALGDRVWVDADGDGAQDPNEVGIPGITLNLITAGPDGLFGTDDDVIAATTTTGAAGYYIFDTLPAGAYVVVVATPPAGYTQTGDPDHFGTTGPNNDNRTTVPVVLGPGDVFLNADFGYQPPAAQDNRVGDTVWFDSNANGVQDAGEPGIPGVTVALIRDSNNNGVWDAGEPIVGTTTTGPSGYYQFAGVPDGAYLVWVNDTDNVLDGKTQTYDSDGVATPNISKVDLDSAGTNPNPVSNQDQDFGYTAAGQTSGKGLIGDTVFIDVNPGDGNAFVPGVDLPIEGVTVRLYNSSGVQVAVTVTDENGNYYFGGLDPNGQYTVVVDTTTLPAGLANSVDPDGGKDSRSFVNLGAPGSDGNADPDGVDNGVNLGQDFGYVPDVTVSPAGSIGDLVWLDANANGVNDGPAGPDGLLGTDDDEPGIGGVSLDLYYDANGNGVVDPGEPKVGSTTTAANGSYLFSNLPTADNGAGPAGADYVVDVTDIAGVLAGYWHSLGAVGLNNNSQIDPYAVSISAAAPHNLTADFGYYVEPAALGNFVWADANGNGIQDNGELGIAGAVVQLVITYPDGSTTTLKVMSDSAGFYSFGNLLLDEDYNGDGAGPEPTHVISVTAPAGYLPTTVNAAGSTVKDDSDIHAGTNAQPIQGLTDVTLLPGNPNGEQLVASYDFGYLPVSACSLTVEKTCVVPAPPPAPYVCTKPIDTLTMKWNGAGNIRIQPWKGAVGSTPLAAIDNIVPGQQVTVAGFAGSPNDVIWEIFNAGTNTKIGQSVFHLSCSDADMNDAADCGKLAGDGKGSSGFLNQWIFDGMSGGGRTLSCTPATQPAANSCEIQLGENPSCKTLGKPTSLTFKYTGGGCSATNNTQGGKATCSGSINPSLPVVVTAGGTGYSVVPTTVNPGETFVVSRSSFDSNSYLTLSNAGGTESLAIHTSCSQVLEVGNIFGSLELVGFNGQTATSPVTYGYKVKNIGLAPLAGITLSDDKLGDVAGGPFSLDPGQERTFSKVADIFQTTTNVATASALNGACVATASATVTVKQPCAVCKGGTVKLTLQYAGANAVSNVAIYDDSNVKADRVLFQGAVVNPGDVITLTPRSGQNRLNKDVSIWINGVRHVVFKSDCSRPIGPGVPFGDFTVTEGISKDNGLMCALLTGATQLGWEDLFLPMVQQ